MVIEMWESCDGAAVSIIDAKEQNPGRPIKIELMSEDDGEVIVFLTRSDFKSLLKAGLRFDEQVYSQ